MERPRLVRYIGSSHFTWIFTFAKYIRASGIRSMLYVVNCGPVSVGFMSLKTVDRKSVSHASARQRPLLYCVLGTTHWRLRPSIWATLLLDNICVVHCFSSSPWSLESPAPHHIHRKWLAPPTDLGKQLSLRLSTNQWGILELGMPSMGIMIPEEKYN